MEHHYDHVGLIIREVTIDESHHRKGRRNAFDKEVCHPEEKVHPFSDMP